MQTDPHTRSSEQSFESPLVEPIGPSVLTRLRLVFLHEPIWTIIVGSAIILPLLPHVPFAYIRIPLGIALVLLLPGYATARALFVGRIEATGMYGIGIGFGISIAIIPMVALLLEFSGIAISPESTLPALAVWTIFWIAIGLYRSVEQAADKMTPAAFGVNFRSGGSLSNRIVPITVSLLVAFLLVAVVMSSISRSEQLDTEFFILGSEGEARDYPYAVEPRGDVAVNLGIHNGSDDVQTYFVLVVETDADSAQRRPIAESSSLLVESGATHAEAISWKMPEGLTYGTFRIELYSQGRDEVHRHLTINVDSLEQDG